MNPQREYVLLSFNPDSQAGIRILVYRSGPSLEVSLPAHWGESLSDEDREYLSELVSDWQSARGESVPAILRELSQLAVGPLKTVESNLLDV
jgi:hypothetical protein